MIRIFLPQLPLLFPASFVLDDTFPAKKLSLRRASVYAKRTGYKARRVAGARLEINQLTFPTADIGEPTAGHASSAGARILVTDCAHVRHLFPPYEHASSDSH